MTDSKIEAFAADVFESVKKYIDHRDDGLIRDMRAVSKALAANDELRQRVTRQAEHIARLESRVAKLERT